MALISCVFGNAFRCCRRQFKRRPTNWTSRKRLSKPVMRWAFDCINFRLQAVCAQDVSSWSSFLQKWWAGDNWLGFHCSYTTVLIWLSKIITRLLCQLRQFSKQREAKPKPFTPCTRGFYRALSKYIMEFLGILIGSSRFLLLLWFGVIFFGFGFSIVIWKLLCK